MAEAVSSPAADEVKPYKIHVSELLASVTQIHTTQHILSHRNQ